ncbi:MAG: hypothetical protein WKF71_09470 [Pyrinomonadaceae bacterium]
MTEKAEKQNIIYRFGRFEINAHEGFFLRDGEVVPLTPKIFETLLLFVQKQRANALERRDYGNRLDGFVCRGNKFNFQHFTPAEKFFTRAASSLSKHFRSAVTVSAPKLKKQNRKRKSF